MMVPYEAGLNEGPIGFASTPVAMGDFLGVSFETGCASCAFTF